MAALAQRVKTVWKGRLQCVTPEWGLMTQPKQRKDGGEQMGQRWPRLEGRASHLGLKGE